MKIRVHYEIREVDAYGDIIDIVNECCGPGAAGKARKLFDSHERVHDEAFWQASHPTSSPLRGRLEELPGVVDIDYTEIATRKF